MGYFEGFPSEKRDISTRNTEVFRGENRALQPEITESTMDISLSYF